MAHTRGLARTFRRLAANAQRLEDTATHILNSVSETKVRDVESFDRLIRAAYQQNGWNERPGRPAGEGQAATVVPPVVRTYVSEVRAAIRLGLEIQRFESFYQLRTALRERREQHLAATVLEAGRRSALRGVRLSSPDKLNGALFHDLIVIHHQLDEESGAALERALKRLFGKYRKLAGELSETEPPEQAAA
jgi:hypothetical protein